MMKFFGGRRQPPTTFKNWMAFATSILLLGLFAFGFVPWWNQLPMVAPLSRYIEENDIEASALFYTEVEETAEAETHIRAALKYNLQKN